MFRAKWRKGVVTKININQRLEQILTEMEMNKQQIKRLRKAKKKLFSKASPCIKDILLKYEELESVERIIVTKAIYIQEVNDTVKKLNDSKLKGAFRKADGTARLVYGRELKGRGYL